VKSKLVTIGIAGGTGSGKTVLARAIASRLDPQDVAIIQHDSYYRDRSDLSPSERKKINYDHPDALETNLLIQHIKDLIAGNAVTIPNYDFSTHCRSDKWIQVNPGRAIILEGLLILANAELRELLDLKIFIDVSSDIRFIRRLQRDTIERNRTSGSLIKQYLSTVRPMHVKYVEPSKQYADIFISDAQNNMTIEAIVSLIKERAREVEYRN